MDDEVEDHGSEIVEFRCNPQHLDKAKRVLRQILSDAEELRTNALRLPFRPDNGLPLNWLCGYGPNGELVLTVQLKTKNVELVSS